jgi:DNA-binding NarL/FixJ family response regulator
MAITVLLADDSQIIRRSIRRLLEAEPRLELVGEAVSFSEAMTRAAEIRPDVILFDIHMPDDKQFDPAVVKSRFLECSKLLLAISVWANEDTGSLATRYGATVLLCPDPILCTSAYESRLLC